MTVFTRSVDNTVYSACRYECVEIKMQSSQSKSTQICNHTSPQRGLYDSGTTTQTGILSSICCSGDSVRHHVVVKLERAHGNTRTQTPAYGACVCAAIIIIIIIMRYDNELYGVIRAISKQHFTLNYNRCGATIKNSTGKSNELLSTPATRLKRVTTQIGRSVTPLTAACHITSYWVWLLKALFILNQELLVINVKLYSFTPVYPPTKTFATTFRKD